MERIFLLSSRENPVFVGLHGRLKRGGGGSEFGDDGDGDVEGCREAGADRRESQFFAGLFKSFG
ncbi:hypothetical protein FEM03_21285 [Phragmitibacter flavus]|uniref:Uncharacterized protein n=1 Tax=Phragmitibacter flavus TaxID=2576071 RepID=A0A5R8K8S2_9BACT|nr:hypothetical protein FEM03_21285 [Phragmitibacter flavus]